MKVKALGVIALALTLVTTSTSAQTEDAPRGHHALRKLGRGFANVLFGIVEVPNQFTKAVDKDGGGAGISYGLPKGLVRWIGRELTGVYEIVTFPIPAPRGYKPIMHPEFPNEDYEP
jgi:putative exosortase-associated protein (TIGR04073 family)